MSAVALKFGNERGLQHHFCGEYYGRQSVLKAGEGLVIHVHDYDHVSLYIGDLILKTNKGLDRLTGAGAVLMKAGVEHAVEAVTDSIWICAHKEDDAEKSGLYG